MQPRCLDLSCGGPGGSGTIEPRRQGPLCVCVISGDQGALAAFVMILWVPDAWVPCVRGIYGAQTPPWVLCARGDLWGWDFRDLCAGGAYGAGMPGSLANVLSPVGW